MPSSFELFRERLRPLFKKHGDKTDFCKAAQIQRSNLDRWLAEEGGGEASLSSLDKVAAAMGVKPWDLIRPDGVGDLLSRPPIPGILKSLPALDQEQLNALLDHVRTLEELNVLRRRDALEKERGQSGSNQE